MKANMFVPSHAQAAQDILPLVELNRKKVHEIAARIVQLCKTPVMFERLLQQIFTGYGLTMTYEQYVLIGSTVRSYLSWLMDTGRVQALIEDNMILWKSVEAA